MFISSIRWNFCFSLPDNPFEITTKSKQIDVKTRNKDNPHIYFPLTHTSIDLFPLNRFLLTYFQVSHWSFLFFFRRSRQTITTQVVCFGNLQNIFFFVSEKLENTLQSNNKPFIPKQMKRKQFCLRKMADSISNDDIEEEKNSQKKEIKLTARRGYCLGWIYILWFFRTHN